jgi:uncharacterized protein YmfQ (DUF2313 family)
MTKKYHPEGFIQICIVCKKDVLKTDDKKMIGLEIPYVNLYIHKECYNEIKDTLEEFMKENLECYLREMKKKVYN